MESRSQMKIDQYFLDSSYAIALVTSDDLHHERAVELSFKIQRDRVELITTRPILLEIGNSLARRSRRKCGLDLLQQMSVDRKLTLVELSAGLYDTALGLFSERMDKEWGLVDCVSFVVMREHHVETALTADRHFVQAGFRALLRET